MRMRLVWMILLSRLLITIILDWGVGVLFACVCLLLVCTWFHYSYCLGVYMLCFLFIRPYVRMNRKHASRINDHIITRLNVWLTYIHESNLR